MSYRKIKAILWKQIMDTTKNKVVLIQFIMFPVLGIIMETTVNIEGLANNYFILLFATMYIGMAPLTSMSAIISEEKEKQTLKVLIMSNVKSIEYLLGVGSYVVIACMVGALIFGITGGYQGLTLLVFIGVMAVGIVVSAMLGAVIGVWSKHQMAATSVTVPVMLLFSFLPMIAMFNEGINKVSRFTYSQQINYLIQEVDHLKIDGENMIVISANILIIMVLFMFAYRRSQMI